MNKNAIFTKEKLPHHCEKDFPLSILIINGDKIIPPVNIETQTVIITFLNCLYNLMLKNIRLKNTKTNPIV